MKTCGFLLLTFAAAGLVSGYVRAEEKLAVVDVQRVLDTVEEGKRAKAEFQKELDGKKNDLDRKQAEFKKLDDNFEKQKMILSPAAVMEKRKDLENKKEELQKYWIQLQADTQKRETQLVGEILKKIKQTVEKAGRDGGYSIVWEKNEGGVVYSKPTFDITDQVISLYDKMYGKK